MGVAQQYPSVINIYSYPSRLIALKSFFTTLKKGGLSNLYGPFTSLVMFLKLKIKITIKTKTFVDFRPLSTFVNLE